MAGIARPFIPWIGSKEKLIPYIWQVFPPSPKLYLEPFGGGGALLLGMQPKISRMDIYNDFNCDLVNLFLCARECTVQLVRELKFIPFHSRAEFDLLKEFMKHKELLQQRIADERNAVMECFSGEEREELLEILRERSRLFDVQRAAAYYKVCRGSFSGTTTSFGVKPNNITNFLYLFDDASKRLQDVTAIIYWLPNAANKYSVSVDDNIWAFADLTKNADSYSSIFDNRYLNVYKQAHDQYGAKVRLNLFYEIDNPCGLELYGPFNLSMMTERYKEEFIANADWLHLAFHAKAELPNNPYSNAAAKQFREEYEMVIREIRRFAGDEVIERATTNHWGSGSKDIVRTERDLGIDALMGYLEIDDKPR